VRVYAKLYVRQRQKNLTTFFNVNEREIIWPIETWKVFLYHINIFVITSRCKGNLVETIVLHI
jgi:hypothetical protein